MKHVKLSLTTQRTAAVLATVAAIGLAGCASSPAYEPPVTQSTYRVPDVRQMPGDPNRDYRRRDQETLYEVPVSSVRTVLGPNAGQRCWIEREEVVQQRRPANVGGAIAGGVIGGILGHQIGGGSGRDIATVGGAVAGAAVGSNVGRNNTVTETRDVQRCTSAYDAPADFYDVSYTFRGVQHQVQMTTHPGRTILVNGNGDPRI